MRLSSIISEYTYLNGVSLFSVIFPDILKYMVFGSEMENGLLASATFPICEVRGLMSHTGMEKEEQLLSLSSPLPLCFFGKIGKPTTRGVRGCHSWIQDFVLGLSSD